MLNTRTKLAPWAIVILAVVICFAGTSMVQAQGVVNGSATATILAALSVTAPNNLIFGTDVLQGVPREIDAATDGSTGVFRISGQVGTTVWASLTLPEYLSHTTNAQDRMPIFFSATSGVWNTTAAAVPSDGGTTFDPQTAITQALGAGGDLAIFLGGKIYPKVNQTAGAYSADIILNVAYTGI